MFFFHLIQPSKLEPEAATRIVGREAGAGVRLELLIAMKLQFVVEIGFDGVAAQQGAEPKPQIAPHGCYTVSDPNTSAMAAVSFSQSLCCVSSWRRPARVSS
jgi:hypothetical protein